MKADKQLRIGVLASVGRLERLSQGETLSGSFGAAHFFLEFSTFFGVYLSIFFNINEIIDNIFLLFSLFCGFSEHFVFLRNLRAINIDFLFQTRFAGFQLSINFLVHIFLVMRDFLDFFCVTPLNCFSSKNFFQNSLLDWLAGPFFRS